MEISGESSIIICANNPQCNSICYWLKRVISKIVNQNFHIRYELCIVSSKNCMDGFITWGNILDMIIFFNVQHLSKPGIHP